jgi:hypothetical protein
MLKKMVFVFASIVLVFDVSFVEAQDRELVGFTTTSTTGSNQGIVGMHELCSLDFPGSRMCTTSDIVRNGVAPGVVLQRGWVHPAAVVEVTAEGITGPNKGKWLDTVSGARSSFDDWRGMLSCFGWTTTGSLVGGLVIFPSGSLHEDPCSDSRPVACCAEAKLKK